MLGHEVVIFNRDSKLGGLNEYGIAAYKTINNFAQAEVDYILSIGGIEVRNDAALGDGFTLDELRSDFSAVFLGVGLGTVNELDVENDNLPGVLNAIEYIADLRQAEDLSALPVGRNVVVVGGGMTAVDIAVQSKRLGAERVDIVYRRGTEQMGASRFEQDLAQTSGVGITYWAQPVRVLGDEHITGIEFVRTELDGSGTLVTRDESITLEADTVFKAIGQKLESDTLGTLQMEHGRIVVDENQRTSLDDVWAGGDCVVGGDDLTVSAVQHGKLAAIAIDRWLRK
jgi:glutamate synthase (NADPH/NADH) small chain